MLRASIIATVVILLGLNAYTAFAQEPPAGVGTISHKGQIGRVPPLAVSALATASDGRYLVNLSAGESADRKCPDNVIGGCYDSNGDGVFDDGAVGCLRSVTNSDGVIAEVHGWSYTIPDGYNFYITDVMNFDDWRFLGEDQQLEGGLWSRMRGQFITIPADSTIRFATPIVIQSGDELCPLFNYSTTYRHEVIVHGELVPVSDTAGLIIFPINALSTASMIVLAFLLGIVLARRLRLRWV